MELSQKDVEWFWSIVDIRGEDDCWNWKGRTNQKGVGLFAKQINKKRTAISAHRLAYSLTFGEISDDVVIESTCENHLCCNPKHLRIQSKENRSNIDEKIIQRFWSKVDIKDKDSCWEWLDGKNENGYGRITVNGKVFNAHRLSYMIEHKLEFIPESMCICHRCDNPGCVSPHHLFMGTKTDNTYDMVNKGRNNCGRGEDHGRTNLHNEDIIFIRENYANGIMTVKDLSNKFSIGVDGIRRIINGQMWKLVGGTITVHEEDKKYANKLNEDIVKEIKVLLKEDKLLNKEIAKLYGVTPETIGHIKSKRTWGYVEI